MSGIRNVENNIAAFVASRRQNAGANKKGFAKNKFTYDKLTAIYTCPEGEILKANGKLYTKQRKGRKKKN